VGLVDDTHVKLKKKKKKNQNKIKLFEDKKKNTLFIISSTKT
jgi:hypothetical protein